MFTSYVRDGVASLFGYIAYNLNNEENKQILETIMKEIQWLGFNDVLLLLSAFADPETDAVITAERKIILSPLVDILQRVFDREIVVSPEPDRHLKQCSSYLPP